MSPNTAGPSPTSATAPPARPAAAPSAHLGAMGAAGAVTVALLWALCYPLITTAVQFAPPLHVGALRAALAACFLIALSLALRRPSPRGADWVAVVAIGVSSTGLGFAGMFLAGGQISPGLATVIANSQPLLAALIGYFALRETLKGWRAAGMIAAFAGIGLVATPALLSVPGGTASVSAAGVGYVLLGAVGVAVGNVLMKRFAPRLDAIAATGWQLLAGSAVLFLAASSQPGSIEWTVPFVLALLGLAIPGTAVAFALWFALIGRAPLNALNVFSFLTPIFALGLGAVFYDERLTSFQAAGAALVVAGAWMAARQSTAAPTRPAENEA